jgi:hypothetical protein
MIILLEKFFIFVRDKTTPLTVQSENSDSELIRKLKEGNIEALTNYFINTAQSCTILHTDI